MFDRLMQIWKVKELRRSILFVMFIVFVARLAAHIPVPGINAENLKNFFNSNQVLGLLNVFSGGGMENFSIVALGVAPYITASIILQLMTMVSPKMEELSKEPGGYAKINTWTRWLTVPLALLQSWSMLQLLKSQSQFQIITDLSFSQTIFTVLTITAGTIFMMWLGDLISERHVGNGISVMIFVGIVSSLPGIISRFFAVYDSSQFMTLIAYALVAIITVVGVVYINEGSRKIPVSYARHVRTGSGPVNNYLPLKVNAAGVIPIIFAVSLLLFPSLIAQFTVRARSEWLVNVSQVVINMTQNQTFYGIAFFLLVFGFTYFYTSIVFHPDQIAENLQRQGGFVPGIRPGEHTKNYLQFVSNRILLAGSIFLGLIAILPILIQSLTGTTNLVFGGTSILIVVSVVIEMIRQIEAQLTMRDYDL